jgi:hypothetical protein
MKTRVLAIFFLCLLTMINASCSLVDGSSSKAVNVATSRAAVRLLIPTDTPQPPTPTVPPEEVVKDIKSAKLTLEDFPDGFRVLSAADMAEMGMTPDKLAGSFTKDMSDAKVYSANGFMSQDGKKMDIVISLVVYPLTMLEKSGFDLSLSDPQAFMKSVTAESGSDAKLLDGTQNIGDKTAAMDYQLEQSSPDDIAARSRVVVTLRGRAVAIVFNIYFNSLAPKVDTIELARKLDARLADALAQ